MRIAVVNTRSDAAQDNRGDVERASGYVHEAGAAGADVVLLPETFPGRWRRPVVDTPADRLGELACEAGTAVVGGFPEPIDGDPDRCWNTVALYGDDGQEIGRYRRTTPDHAPWIYARGPLWDFEWVPAEELPVFDVADTRVGVLTCSEVFVPELARVLATRGAEVLLMPAGVIRPSSELFEAWRTVAWARAIENLAVVALCANTTPTTRDALAYVCEPEGVLLERHEVGVHIVDVDLDRLRWLRKTADGLTDGPKPWRVKPGVLRDWRRPSVLVPATSELTGGGMAMGTEGRGQSRGLDDPTECS